MGRLVFLPSELRLSDQREQRDDAWCASGADVWAEHGTPAAALSAGYGPALTSCSRPVCWLLLDKLFLLILDVAADAASGMLSG